jgi:drug/metabolite transporter (DMT)-like permease
MGNVTLFAKLLPFPATTIISGRALIACILLFLFLLYRGKNIRVSSKSDLFKILGIGVIFGLHWVTYFHSIKVSTVAIGMLSLFTYPVFTAIFEPIFEGKKIDPFSLVLALFAFAGLTMMIPSFDWNDTGFQGVMWGLVSAVLYSLRNILTKQMHIHYSSAHLLSLQLFATAFLLVPFADGLFEMISNPQYLLYQVVLAGFFTAFAHTLWIRSFSQIPVVTAGIFSTISPFYGILSAWFFLGETPPEKIWLGGGVILFCAIMEIVRTSKK